MDRIIPEKQAAIMVAVFGLAIGATFGWGHLEAESKKQHLLTRNDFVELNGACTHSGLVYNPSPGYKEVSTSYNISGFSFSTAVHGERVINESRSQNRTPAWLHSSISSRNNPLPGFIYISSGFSVVDSMNLEDIIIPQQAVEGVLFCPSLVLQDIKSR